MVQSGLSAKVEAHKLRHTSTTALRAGLSLAEVCFRWVSCFLLTLPPPGLLSSPDLRTVLDQMHALRMRNIEFTHGTCMPSLLTWSRKEFQAMVAHCDAKACARHSWSFVSMCRQRITLQLPSLYLRTMCHAQSYYITTLYARAPRPSMNP